MVFISKRLYTLLNIIDHCFLLDIAFTVWLNISWPE